jgi:2-amino-4-hydroxy-6-hydroxymethyldihydropteridine diphosphokinase
MNTAYIGMGSNLASWAGTTEATLTRALLRLDSLGEVVCHSSLYSTAPVGFAAQPRFVNAVAVLQTELTPPALLRALLALEQEFGRNRSTSFTNGPRTLDLDILFFGDCEINTPELVIPHPRLAERAFALVPLDEIASRFLDPSRGETIEQLFSRLLENSPAELDTVTRVEYEAWEAR